MCKGGKCDLEKNKLDSILSKFSKLPKSFLIKLKEKYGAIDIGKHKIEEEIKVEKRFPENIDFYVTNYIKDLKAEKKYDTVLCFSTIMWIHLNFGDDGVKRLFKKVSNNLNIGGYFIID